MRRIATSIAVVGLLCGTALPALATPGGTVSHSYVTGGISPDSAGSGVVNSATCDTQLVGAPDVDGTCFTFGELAGAASVDITISDLASSHVAGEYQLFQAGGGYGSPHYFCDSVSNVAIPTPAGPDSTTAVFVFPIEFTDGGPCAAGGPPTAGAVSVTLH